MIRIELTDIELRMCTGIASDRHYAAIGRGHVSQGNASKVEDNVLGIKGEYALLKYLGLPVSNWHGLWFNPDKPDVDRFEVRTRTPPGKMGIKTKKFEHQKPSQIFVLAWTTPKTSHVDLVGWTTLDQVALFGVPHESWPSIFMPTEKMLPMEVFPC